MSSLLLPLLTGALLGGGSLPADAGVTATGPADGPSVADTVLAVRRGDALVVETLGGRLLVEGWDDDVVELNGEGMGLVRRGDRITLDTDRRRHRREGVARLRVPRWMPVSVSGRELDVEVTSLAAPVSLRTLEGDLTVRDVAGPVTLRAVDGDVRATGITGSVSALAVNDAVILRDVRGETVRAESTDGDLVLDGVEGRTVEAETVDGDVRFEGAILPDGRYRFVTHDGDVAVRIPASTGARVSVSTYDGEFTSEVPVVLDRYRGGRAMTFTLGSGGATLEIQAFDGDIWLGWR